MEELCVQVFDKFISLSFGTKSSNYVHLAGDGVPSYSIQLLRIGCLYMEFADAIREGDGERVIRCWRYFMPVFRAAQCTNYACESFNLLYQHLYALSPRLSNQLMWSRFVNVHGQPGRNIPVDLHMINIWITLRRMQSRTSDRTKLWAQLQELVDVLVPCRMCWTNLTVKFCLIPCLFSTRNLVQQTISLLLWRSWSVHKPFPFKGVEGTDTILRARTYWSPYHEKSCLIGWCIDLNSMCNTELT